MADDPPSVAEAEAAAIRRRWITLAEILGVAGLVVSGLALWNSYQERTGEAADKAAARREALAQSRTVVLRGTADRDGARLSLAPADPAQTIQSQTIVFPTALAVEPIDTVADSRIEARWFRGGILRATAEDEERAESREGDRQVPIAIVTRFYSGGSMFTDWAVYSLIYRVEGGGLFEGRKIRLRGISRLQPARVENPAAARARIDAMWAARRGGPRPGG
jgi:hypothetical protein